MATAAGGAAYWLRWEVLIAVPMALAAALLLRLRRLAAPLRATDLWVPCWSRLHPGRFDEIPKSLFAFSSLKRLHLIYDTFPDAAASAAVSLASLTEISLSGMLSQLLTPRIRLALEYLYLQGRRHQGGEVGRPPPLNFC